MNQKRPWAFRLSFANILLLAVAIVINIFGNWISGIFMLPFRLDMIGTIFAAGLLGPFAGGIVGGLSGCISAVVFSTSIAYAVAGILVGIVVGIIYPEDTLDIFQILCTSAIAAIIAVLASTPINLISCDGYTRNLWGDALVDMMMQSGNSMIFSSVLGEALVDIPDKVISVFFAAGAAKVWCRFYPAAKKGGAL